jgi:Domain of unknown function (DUF5658)
MNTISCVPVRTGRAPAFWVACVLIYVLLSGVDLWLTWLLIEGMGGAYEANPLAADILARYGWPGLALFKGGCVALVLGAGACLWHSRPRTARLLLGLGAASSVVVVGYSLWVAGFGVTPPGWRQDMDDARVRGARLDALKGRQKAYGQRLEELTDDVMRGRRTLRNAAEALDQYLDEIRHDARYYLNTFYAEAPREAVLAAHLVRQVGYRTDNPDEARRQLRNLAEQFAGYHALLPAVCTEPFRAAIAKANSAKTQPSRRGAAN